MFNELSRQSNFVGREVKMMLFCTEEPDFNWFGCHDFTSRADSIGDEEDLQQVIHGTWSIGID
jgi:hypothetical protein